MNANAYAHGVAVYMGQLFDFRLAKVTCHPVLPQEPLPLDFISSEVLSGCSHAVNICIEAFTHPGEYPVVYSMAEFNVLTYGSLCRRGLHKVLSRLRPSGRWYGSELRNGG